MSSIEIRQIDITKLETDAIVNAANDELLPVGSVSGAIFREAGFEDLQEACERIGHCDTGSSVITPGFDLRASFIIHSVGPVWSGGTLGEPELLEKAYRSALLLAQAYDCHSIGLPLLSAGAFGYPVDKAWDVAIRTVQSYLDENPNYDMEIIFAVMDEGVLKFGERTLSGDPLPQDKTDEINEKFAFFRHPYGQNGFLSNKYPAPFTLEGITYKHSEQYKMAKKALLFEDFKYYFMILEEDDPEKCKEYGRQVRYFQQDIWNKAKQEIVYNATYAKFAQNKQMKKSLLETGDKTIAKASPYDKIWGIGLSSADPDAHIPISWKGENLLGKILMDVRERLREEE